MSTEFFRNYINVITEAEQVDVRRRGFLVGLASFAAEIGMGSPVVKLLSTPAGIAALPVAAAIALLKGIQKHLDQFDADDDDDYIESQEEMADALGFVEKEGNDGFDNSSTDQLTELLDLYDKNPELAAAQLTKHLQSAAINPPDVKSSFKSRADDPNDWRYNNKMTSDASDTTSDIPEENKIVIYATDFDGNIVDTYVKDNRTSDPIKALNKVISDQSSRFYKYTKYTATNGGKPVKIDNEKYIDPSKLSTALSREEVLDKMFKMWDANIDQDDNSPMNIANISRLSGMATGINSASNQEPNTTVEPTGSIQPAKNTIALPAPTKPEFDLTPNFKSKEKVPVRRNGKNGLSESTELSSILKNAGLKTGKQR
jgi:hypothetical protein